MNKVFLFALIIISGCASNSLQKVGIDPTSNEAPIIITNKCSSICQKIIKSKYNIDGMSSILGNDNVVSKYVVLHKLNGQAGKGTHYDHLGAYNISWDGSFNIETNSGETEVTIIPSARYNAPNEEVTLNFEAISGHSYMIGSMGWREILGGTQINNWHPVVFDLNENRIVYPISDPKWRKYCTKNQEWSGNVSCPN
jgi:hypothetical protein